jgi:hypothetical protein
MKTIGDTFYDFPSKLISGKKPELCETSKYPRKTKEVKVRVLRDWQKAAFNRLKDSKFFLVKAFCGSGKTTLSIVLALWDLIKNKRKQLFIVPQSHIGDGFCVSGKFQVPGLGIISLSKPKNFCEDSDNKTEMLISFLLGDLKQSSSIKEVFTKKGKKEYVVFGNACMAVATHQCYVAAIEKIAEREEKGESGLLDKCFKNMNLCIDEAHHVKTGSSKEEIDEQNAYNKLGKVLNSIYERADKNNSRIGLFTATFHRGDQGIIVHSDCLKKFDKFELEFLDHFETLGIEKVYVNFEEYDVDPIDQIVSNIEREPTERHMIVVPHGSEKDGQGKKWRKFDTFLLRLKSELRKMLERNGLNFDDVVLDLVDKGIQNANKVILLKEPKERYEEDESKNSKVRIVMTCMLGREGTDWCPCSRLHNSSIEFNSTTLAVQTLGRLFRKFLNKNNVGVTYYIKRFDSLESCESKREFVSNRVNAVLALMMIDDFLNPILLPKLPLAAHEGAKRDCFNKNKSEFVRLRDAYSHEDLENIKREITDFVSREPIFEESSVEKIIKGVIGKIDDSGKLLYEKKIPIDNENIIAGLKVFILRARSELLRSKGIDISKIRESGFDIIVEKNKLEGNFWAGILTGKILRDFEGVVGKIYWKNDQNQEIVDNIRVVISNEKGEVSIVDMQKTLKDFCDFHESYNEVSKEESAIMPTHKALAEKLGISIDILQEKIKFFNKIAPKGYKFFHKKSKITDKFSPNAA